MNLPEIFWDLRLEMALFYMPPVRERKPAASWFDWRGQSTAFSAKTPDCAEANNAAAFPKSGSPLFCDIILAIKKVVNSQPQDFLC